MLMTAICSSRNLRNLSSMSDSPLFTFTDYEKVLMFLHHCDFLGQRAARLAEELSELITEHLECLDAWSSDPRWHEFYDENEE